MRSDPEQFLSIRKPCPSGVCRGGCQILGPNVYMDLSDNSIGHDCSDYTRPLALWNSLLYELLSDMSLHGSRPRLTSVSGDKRKACSCSTSPFEAGRVSVWPDILSQLGSSLQTEPRPNLYIVDNQIGTHLNITAVPQYGNCKIELLRRICTFERRSHKIFELFLAFDISYKLLGAWIPVPCCADRLYTNE
jgi:hypothetical protein